MNPFNKRVDWIKSLHWKIRFPLDSFSKNLFLLLKQASKSFLKICFRKEKCVFCKNQLHNKKLLLWNTKYLVMKIWRISVIMIASSLLLSILSKKTCFNLTYKDFPNTWIVTKKRNFQNWTRFIKEIFRNKHCSSKKLFRFQTLVTHKS